MPEKGISSVMRSKSELNPNDSNNTRAVWNKLPKFGKRAIVGAIAGSALLSSCGSSETVSATPVDVSNNEPAASAPVSPEKKVPEDVFHAPLDDLIGLTSDQIYPLSGDYEPERAIELIDSNPSAIFSTGVSNLEAMTNEEAVRSFVQKNTDGINTLLRMYESPEYYARAKANGAAVESQAEKDYILFWQIVNQKPGSTPSEEQLSTNQALLLRAHLTLLAQDLGHEPDYPTSAAFLPNLDSISYTENPDGTVSISLEQRAVSVVDPRIITKMLGSKANSNTSDPVDWNEITTYTSCVLSTGVCQDSRASRVDN